MTTYNSMLNKLEQTIADIKLPSSPQLLYNPVNYILEDGGKRMRPILMLLSASAFVDNVDSVYKPAIALEIFHNFTLLHDDIMDNADIRRGRATVHKKWSENVAILSGDAMLILAYRIMTDSVELNKLAQTLAIFNKASLEVCEGQQFDMDFETAEKVELDEYLNMIRLKTSVLMAAATQIGALLGGADEMQQKAFYDFGVNFGLAFQIQDDILDTYGDKDTFGKKIGGDIEEGKKTFLYINAYNRADDEQKEVLENSRDFNAVKAVYDSVGVRDLATEAVQRYFSDALKSLESADGYNVSAVVDYAYSLLNRDK